MARQDLGKIISEITSATATVDNKVGVPSVEVTLGGTQTDKEINFDFKNIKGEKGDKPVKGTDYFTEEEKQQFTTETVGLITAEGEKQVTAIGEKGTTETQKVTAEGTKQVTAVRNQGNTSLQAVNKVQEDIEALLRNQTVEGNALSLNGKTGVQYDKEIQGVAGRHDGTFPLTSAVKDGVYLVPSTGKLYVCITAYNGGQLSAPNSNFEEFSVYKNRDRLGNLKGYEHLTAIKLAESNIETEVYDFAYFFNKPTFPFLEIIVFLHGKSNWWGGVYCAKYATWSRQSEMITEIYNQNIGSHLASKIRFDKSAKKLYITPYEQNMICDIYILEIPATVL